MHYDKYKSLSPVRMMPHKSMHMLPFRINLYGARSLWGNESGLIWMFMLYMYVQQVLLSNTTSGCVDAAMAGGRGEGREGGGGGGGVRNDIR